MTHKNHIFSGYFVIRQKDRKTERQKDRKTERQKDKKAERQSTLLKRILLSR
jgi:hypothetical protein